MTPEQIEARPFPFYGYAPGNYLNTCSCCKKDMYNVDKLCFVCIECAIKFSQSEIDQLKERVKELEEGLQDLVWWHTEDLPDSKFDTILYTAKQLLTNKPNNNG